MMKYANSAVAVVPTKAITATDTGSTAVEVGEFTGLGLMILNSSAGTGTTPTSTVKIQHSADGSTNWADFLTFDAQGATASFQSKLVQTNDLRKFVRAVNTLGGATPGYSYGVTLVGIKQYA